MRSRLLLLTLPIVAFFFTFSPMSQAAVQDRITSAVTGGHVSLPNTIPARALRATDLGPAPAARKLDSLSLRFNMTDAQQADLTQLLANQQNPSSASYHQWLTPEQFGARFGLSNSDIAKVSSWLTGQGFTVTGVAHSSTFITFTGTVAQVQQAFGTSIHTVSLNGEQHIANLTDPVLPSSIAGVVNAITGLNDFKVKPRVRVSSVKVDPSQPNYTYTSGGVTSHYIAPGDFYTIYDVNPLITSSINGTGITIGVMGQTTISLADVAAFRSASGLSAAAPVLQLTGANPGLSSDDIDEAQLDTEWSGAVAPNATIKYVYGVDVFANSLTYTIDTAPVPPIVSISYGLCESGFGTSFLNTYTLLLQQANAEGMTIITPAGDSGAADCDEAGLATEGLAVDFPASSPFTTAMGGTMFNEGSGSYWNTTNGTNSGSAKSYIPELPWNETNASTGLTAGGAGGGGASAFFSKPAWQVGTGVPADSSRDVPDISLNAAAIHDGYIVCSQGSCTNGYLNSSGQINVFGGTSVAVPSFAGILALTEQKLGTTTGLGNIGPNLYGLAGSQYATNVFHDITSGNNAVPCIQGTPNCGGSSFGYTAGPGYDQATGLGSLDAFNLANDWKLGTPTGGGSTIGTIPTNTVLSTSSAMCAISSGSFPLSVTVSSIGASSSTPSGSVQFFVDNVAVGSPVPLSSGSATYTLSTAGLASGQHNVSAVYSGDATFAGSKGSFFQTGGTILPIDVVSTTSADFSITPCTAASTVVTGNSAGAITVTITPFGGFQGSVNFAANSDTGDVLGYAFSVKPVVINSGSAVTTSFVLTATEPSTSATLKKLKHGRSPLGRTPWYAAGSGATLACMLFLTVPRRRRWASLLALVLSVAIIGAAGCSSSSSTTGGGGGGGGGNPILVPVAPGVYNITITATSGTLVHSSVFTYTVVQ